MNIPDISFKIRRLVALDVPVEALKVLFSDLAVELDREEARLAKERERKRPGISAPAPGNAPETPAFSVEAPVLARVSNIPLLPEVSKNNPLPLSEPLPKNSRAHGTNPRALKANPRSIEVLFPQFWDAYPNRPEGDDRKPAVKAFTAAMKRTDFETIMHGVKRYIADLKAKGNYGTDYVKKARSWLNDDSWAKYDSKLSEPGAAAVEQVPVVVDTPAWHAWMKVKPRTPLVDLKLVNGQVKRGWYFPTEYPTQQENHG